MIRPTFLSPVWRRPQIDLHDDDRRTRPLSAKPCDTRDAQAALFACLETRLRSRKNQDACQRSTTATAAATSLGGFNAQTPEHIKPRRYLSARSSSNTCLPRTTTALAPMRTGHRCPRSIMNRRRRRSSLLSFASATDREENYGSIGRLPRTKGKAPETRERRQTWIEIPAACEEQAPPGRMGLVSPFRLFGLAVWRVSCYVATPINAVEMVS